MSTEAAVRAALCEMEDDIYAVEQHGRLLSHVAATPNLVEAECLNAMSWPLVDLGHRLREKFVAAFAAAGGRAS